MAEYTLRPSSEGFAQWTKIDGLATKWQELAAETEIDPKAPTLTHGVRNTETNQHQSLIFQIPTLAAGEKVTGVTFHFYAKTSAVASFVSTYQGSGALPEKTGKPNVAGTKWWSYGNSGANGALWTQAELEAKLLSEGNVTLFLASEKAAEQFVYEAYLILTTVTEGEHAARSCGDTVTLSDSAVRTTAQARTCADAIVLSDESSGLLSKLRTCGDTVAVSDSAVRAAQPFARSAGDTVAVSDAAARAGANARTAGDSVSVGDSASRATSAPRTVGVTVTVADSATRGALSRARTAQDAISITDSASKALNGARTAGDTVVTFSEARAEAFVPPPSILTFGYAGTRANTPAYATTTLKTFAYAGTRLATDAEVKTI